MEAGWGRPGFAATLRTAGSWKGCQRVPGVWRLENWGGDVLARTRARNGAGR